MKRFALLLLVVTSSTCTQNQAYTNIRIPDIHFPSAQIPLSELTKYRIAYCWIPSQQTSSSSDDKEVDVVLSNFRNDSNQVISTRDIKILASPFLPKQEGHPTGYDLGCFSVPDYDIRYSGNRLFWRPKSNELAFAAGINPVSADFRLFSIGENLAFAEQDLPTPHDYATLFHWPRGVFWSPNGEQFAFLGLDNQLQDNGNNIWVYNLNQKTFQRTTNFLKTGNDVTTASWSSDGTKLAIGYGGPESGVGIADINGSQKYIEISSKTNSSVLNSWHYWFDSSWVNFARSITTGKDSAEIFTSELVSNSIPIWLNSDQSILFVAANKQDQATLFVVNKDGTQLHELLPGLPGIAFMPRLSPDETTLAFVRFPDWNDRSKVEVAMLDLRSMRVQSVAVFPKLSDGSILFISGMDWSPDSKYLAFSAPYKTQSDIFIVTRDGKSWFNLAEHQDGDAVSPAWAP